MTFRADFASKDYFRDPAAAIARLRAMGPVVEVRFPIIGKVWATTTQALADRVLKDTATFAIDQAANRGRWVDAGAFAMTGAAISVHLANRGTAGAYLVAGQVRISCTASAS